MWCTFPLLSTHSLTPHSLPRHYAETISDLHSASIQLSTRPETSPAYNLRLYPISLERGALLSSIELQERHTLQTTQTAYEEESRKVENEWTRSRDSIRERMLNGIEERRRRAREEKDGEGTVMGKLSLVHFSASQVTLRLPRFGHGSPLISALTHTIHIPDGSVDSQSRPHITRKLRNKMGGGTSPPPTPIPGGHPGLGGGASTSNAGSVAFGPLLNPHSLAIEDLPSVYPLPLIFTGGSGSQSYNYGAGTGTSGNGRRRAKNNREAQVPGTLGKSLSVLHPIKEADLDADLGEIRRGNKRRRAAAGGLAGKA